MDDEADPVATDVNLYNAMHTSYFTYKNYILHTNAAVGEPNVAPPHGMAC